MSWFYWFNTLINPPLGFGGDLFSAGQCPVSAPPRVASEQLWEHRPRNRTQERPAHQRAARRRRHRQPARQVMTSQTARVVLRMEQQSRKAFMRTFTHCCSLRRKPRSDPRASGRASLQSLCFLLSTQPSSSKSQKKKKKWWRLLHIKNALIDPDIFCKSS